jgi:hypothetical protein
LTKYEEIEKLKTENKNLRMELQEIKEIPELQTAFQFHTQTSNRPPSSSTVSSKKMYKRPVSLLGFRKKNDQKWLILMFPIQLILNSLSLLVKRDSETLMI